LSSLISENPRQAGAFLDELSSVYRYLLQTNERDLTPLRNELDFIRSYYHLLKTRYGAAIALYREVDEAYLDAQLPPLTLQLLVENAVKHNALLPEDPLTISILTTEAGELVVANTIHRRSVRVASNRVGLANIASRYRLLHLKEPVIEDDGRFFIVRLPLLLSAPSTKPVPLIP
jgi:LytS/YehU family sensor histidine kinase